VHTPANLAVLVAGIPGSTRDEIQSQIEVYIPCANILLESDPAESVTAGLLDSRENRLDASGGAFRAITSSAAPLASMVPTNNSL